VSPAIEALQGRLGHQFSQPSLLARALTHKSFGSDHYERLEFLGDAVLSLCVSALLYRHFDRSDEGDLTRVRAHLVRQDMLHRLAVQLELPALLRLSEGEAKGGGAQRPSILADALEAVFGAVYLDAGFFEPLLAESTLEGWTKDAKTALQEWLQGRKLPVPTYRIEATRGKAHEQVFVVVCEVPDLGVQAQGEGTARRSAEQAAAAEALQQLKALPAERTRGAAPVVVVKKARPRQA
jgi:ribonuclease III